MRTLRQIEEEFRQLDQRQGRQNPYYSKEKLKKKSKGRESFWDVLAPGENVLDNERQNASGSSTQNSTSSSLGSGMVRLRPAAVHNRITSLAEKAQSSMASELQIRRKDVKQILKRTSTQTPDSTRRSSVLEDVDKSYSSHSFPANVKTSHPKSSMKTVNSKSSSTQASKLYGSTKIENTPSKQSKNLYIDTSKARPIANITEDTTKSKYSKISEDSYLQSNSNIHSFNIHRKDANPDYTSLTKRITHLNDEASLQKIEKGLEKRQTEIKKTLQQIGYDDTEFYQFRIRVQNYSNINIYEATRVFMIVTQDDNPSLVAKIHDLAISDDMYILFPNSILEDKSLFSPTNYLPWVNEPIDLLNHKLSVEIFVGIRGETSIIAKSTVKYTELEGVIPSKKLQKSKSTFDAIDRAIDKRNLAPLAQTSEIEDHDYVTSTAVNQEAVLSPDKRADKSTEEPFIHFSDVSEKQQVQHSQRNVRVLKIDMQEEPQNDIEEYSSPGRVQSYIQGPFMSQASLEEYALQRSSISEVQQAPINNAGPNNDDNYDIDEIDNNLNRDEYLEDTLGVNSQNLLNLSIDTNGSSEGIDSDKEGDEESVELAQSKLALQALRERLKNRMGAGMV